MRVLLVDNYDSFTGNLAQLIAVVVGAPPRVVRNDERTLAELLAWRPERVILSPGPGRPEVPGDVGVCRALVEQLEVPLLGVCLGHQLIAHCAGARIIHAPTPMHGRRSTIHHTGSGLFASLPDPLQVVRYHSLIVERDSLPASLQLTAWSDDGLVMALSHRDRPQVGVQFHPESILTEHGRAIIERFLAPPAGRRPPPRTPTPPPGRPQPGRPPPTVRAVPWREPSRVFDALFATARDAFWLDSAAGRGRFSYLGASDGAMVRATRRGVQWLGATPRRLDPDLFTALQQLLDQERVDRSASPTPLPDFLGGWVGWLGYGLKRLAGGEPEPDGDDEVEAELMHVTRFIAFDHLTRAATLLAFDDPAWLDATAGALAALPDRPPAPLPPGSPSPPIRFRLARGRARYLADIARVQQLLGDGESYQICLTTQAVAEATVDPLTLYHALRRRNPAPYAALLRFGDRHLLSSSPERFLRIDADGAMESRPIKGTSRRHPDPALDRAAGLALANSEKERAENLMITDLVRSDLGRVAEPGSVHVPHLMAIEEHPTVLQMVTTVRALLATAVAPLEAVRALFPGGSMTGAPKLRSLRIIDQLEGAPRGAYAGGFGLFGLDGTVDLAMTIRTLIHQRQGRRARLSFGTGGAIVALSDPAAEIDEIHLKASALLDAVSAATGAPCSLE